MLGGCVCVGGGVEGEAVAHVSTNGLWMLKHLEHLGHP